MQRADLKEMVQNEDENEENEENNNTSEMEISKNASDSSKNSEILKSYHGQISIRSALERIGFESTEVDIYTVDATGTSSRANENETPAVKILVTGIIKKNRNDEFKPFVQSLELKQGLTYQQ